MTSKESKNSSPENVEISPKIKEKAHKKSRDHSETFKCEECDYTTVHKGHYAQHLARHANPKPKDQEM